MLLNEVNEIIEGILFIKGEEGLTLEFFSEFMNLEKNNALNTLNIFKENYNKKNGALVVKKFGNTYKMLVKEDVYSKIKNNLEDKKMYKLSKATLETLAIIAYNQPISKIEIDNIRGVNSDSVINSLLEKELIFSNKTSDKIGKPKLYETTDLFLDIFGIENLDELPKIKDDINDNQLEEFLSN